MWMLARIGVQEQFHPHVSEDCILAKKSAYGKSVRMPCDDVSLVGDTETNNPLLQFELLECSNKLNVPSSWRSKRDTRDRLYYINFESHTKATECRKGPAERMPAHRNRETWKGFKQGPHVIENPIVFAFGDPLVFITKQIHVKATMHPNFVTLRYR